jgi:hypothetical protein
MRHARFALAHLASGASESPSNDFARVNPHERAPSTEARAHAPNTHSDCNHAGAGGKRRAERAPGRRVRPRRRWATAGEPYARRHRRPRATSLRISVRGRCAGLYRPLPNTRCARSAHMVEGCRTSGSAGRQSDARIARSMVTAAAAIEPNSGHRRCLALRRRPHDRSSRRRSAG